MTTATIILALIAVTIPVLVFWWRLRHREIKSFWDVVRNPEKMPSLDEFHRKVNEAATSLSGSPTEIAKLVDFFVFDATSSQDAWTELRVLAKLGSEAYPRALEILRDPSLKARLTVLQDHEHSVSESPLGRLCKIFDQGTPPPEEAAALLKPFLQSDSDDIRKSAALLVGSISASDSLPDLRLALADENEYVRSYALMGIQRAIDGDRIKASFKDDLFQLIADMWTSDTIFSGCDKVPQILLKLDRHRAVSSLLSDELCSIRHRPVWRILEAFKEESIPVPRALLLSIVTEAGREPIEYPSHKLLEKALALLGEHRREEDLAMLERYVDHSNVNVSRGATEALYQFHQYYELIRDSREVAKQQGWQALTLAEQHILAIEELDAEINNGGFAQYYFNSSGDHWQQAFDGLAAIGAEKRHRLMLATLESFGPTRPAADRKTRTSQLAKIVRKKENPYNDQDREWYKTADEHLDRLLLRYNLANLKGRNKTQWN